MRRRKLIAVLPLLLACLAFTVLGQADQPRNTAPTISPVFKAYCAAFARNDERGLRHAFSSETLAKLRQEMKEEKTRSLLKLLRATDRASHCSARDETIEGDTAVATIFSSKYPHGIQVVFIKEDGAWKLTDKSPAIDKIIHKAP